jgi:hypothetical protein
MNPNPSTVIHTGTPGIRHVYLDVVPHPGDFRQVWARLDAASTDALIGLGGNFRTPQNESVDVLFDEMKNGRFAWSLEPFAVISTEQHLIDGNHRLHAYARYLAAGGDPAVVEVRYGVDPSWAHLYDAGRIRTTSQRAKAVGLNGAIKASTTVTALWYLSQTGTLRHENMPPSFVLNLLGPDAEHYTLQRVVIEEAVRLHERIAGKLDKSSRHAFNIGPVTSMIALWLAEDEGRARDVAFALVAAAEFAPSKTTTGAAAVMSILRSTRHTTVIESSGWFPKERTMLALAILWCDPTISYAALERRLLHGDRDKMNDKTIEQRHRYAPALREAAAQFIDTGAVTPGCGKLENRPVGSAGPEVVVRSG